MGSPILSALHEQVEEIPLETFLLLGRDVQETLPLSPGRSAFQQNSSELISEQNCCRGHGAAWGALRPRAFITLKSSE